MISNKKPAFMPHYDPVPEPTTGGTTSPKRYLPLDVRYNVSDPSCIYPNTTLPITYEVTRKNPTHVPTNRPI